MRNIVFSLLLLVTLAAPLSAPLARGAGSRAEQRYLRALHKKFHPLWVGTVLARVQRELGADDPFNTPGRKVTLRLHFSARGAIRSAKVVRGSGHAPFDSTARSVVLGIFDFPTPPASARSDDGDVYVDWTFHRSRPWCHPSTARIVKVPFTVSVLGRGHIARAITLLEQAHRHRRLHVYGHDFGLQLVRLAARKLGSRAAPLLVRVLDSQQPIEVLRTAFRGSLQGQALRQAIRGLVHQRPPEAGALLATLFSMAYPEHPHQAAAYLEGLVQRPAAAKNVWKEVRAAAGHADPAVAAPAARLLMARGSAADKSQGETTLRRLITSRKAADTLHGIAQLNQPALTARFLPDLKRIVLNAKTPTKVQLAVARCLGRLGTDDAGRVLLMQTYTHRAKVGEAAVEALHRTKGPHLARCYRYWALVTGARTAAAVKRSAAEGLARHCLREFFVQIKNAVRRRPAPVRQGLARGLPATNPKVAKLLNRLARDPVARVRRAALATMVEHPGPAWRRILRRTERKHPKLLRALRCAHHPPRSLRGPCFTATQGEARLRLARHLIRVAPDLVFPWLLPKLKSTSWKHRLEAAWVLLGLPEP